MLEDLPLEGEEAAVDPNRRPLDILDGRHQPISIARDQVVAQVRLDAHEAGHRVLPAELLELMGKRQVAEPVAVVREEFGFVADDALDGLQPLADVRLQAGLDERDLPVVDVAGHQLELLPALRQDEVVRQRLGVVQEIVLDDIAAISEAQHEVLVPEVGVVLHHVPQNRPVADGHHRLRHVLSGLPNPHAETAAKQHDLHLRILSRAVSTVPHTGDGLPAPARRVRHRAVRASSS